MPYLRQIHGMTYSSNRQTRSRVKSLKWQVFLHDEDNIVGPHCSTVLNDKSKRNHRLAILAIRRMSLIK